MLDGDIVDENTTTAQMGSAFQILSTIDSKYGIYYTYGNHDKNNYATTPNYTADQLAETIKENSIQILEDDTTIINDEIALIGRADRGDRSARQPEKIMRNTGMISARSSNSDASKTQNSLTRWMIISCSRIWTANI